MGIRRGEITTKIISDGLIFNFDAANRASYVNGSTKTFNTIDLSQSGSLENSPTFISSPAAWDFDGSDTYINCGDIEMDGITGLTVEAWCKSDVTDSSQRRIVSKDQQGVQGAWILLVQSGDLKWQTHDGAWNIVSYGSYSEDTNWHHMVGTLRDGTNTLYLDGAAVASIGSVGALDDADNEEIVIGADSDVGANTFLWNGQIANVKIYNRGLSPSEVLQNFNGLRGRFGV